MDRDNPNLLLALDELCAIFAQYDLKNVYNMDETNVFFGCCLNIAYLCHSRMLVVQEVKKI